MNTLPKDIKNIIISYNKINLNDRHPVAIIMRPMIEYCNNTERDWFGLSYITWFVCAKYWINLKLDENSLEYLRWRILKIKNL